MNRKTFYTGALILMAVLVAATQTEYIFYENYKHEEFLDEECVGMSREDCLRKITKVKINEEINDDNLELLTHWWNMLIADPDYQPAVIETLRFLKQNMRAYSCEESDYVTNRWGCVKLSTDDKTCYYNEAHNKTLWCENSTWIKID
jgi:hypothetical protein